MQSRKCAQSSPDAAEAQALLEWTKQHWDEHECRWWAWTCYLDHHDLGAAEGVEEKRLSLVLCWHPC